MAEYQIITLDPWLKNVTAETQIPSDATFLCAYGVHVGVDTIDEAAFIRRTADTDELWLAIEPDPEILDSLADGAVSIEIDLADAMQQGCAVVALNSSNQARASRALLNALFRARVGFGWPTYVIHGGAISKRSFRTLIRAIKRDLDDNARRASCEEAEIVVAARELRLSPEATGTGPHHWRASCPETNHGLYIQSDTNQFGCGYCRRKGGPEELRAFVVERRARRADQRRTRPTSAR
jgi:hypothetical protein